jgi:hypothetical protein
MAKPNNRLAKRLSSIRAGNLEDQRDKYLDDVYIDPNRYFRLPNTFGLTRGPYERAARAAPEVLEGISTKEHDLATRRRTRGIAGPNPDEADMAFMMAVPSQSRALPSGRTKEAKRGGKKRY